MSHAPVSAPAAKLWDSSCVRMITASFGFGLITGQAAAFQVVQKSSLSINKPAFVYIDQSDTEAGTTDLLVTSFGFLGNDPVYRIKDVGSSSGDISKLSSEVVTYNVRWPNEAKVVPDEVFGPGKISIAGGFLVPGKSTGAITIVEADGSASFEISRPKRSFFYHQVSWVDMNGDGRLDVLTARAKKPIFGASKGELVWFEQPTSDAQLKGPWQEHVIAQGPDVHFRVQDLDQDGQVEVLATEFFSKSFSVLWKGQEGTWQRRVVDGELGSAFDLEMVDLNQDGNLDVLVTNHEGDAKASVFAYEIPADFRTADWTRHTLLTGIVTRKGGINAGSPGEALSFHPQVTDQSGKPCIIVAGDASERVHLLKPNSQDPADWSYQASVLLETGSTVGKISLADSDGDGWLEAFVPAYDTNLLYMLSFGAE